MNSSGDVTEGILGGIRSRGAKFKNPMSLNLLFVFEWWKINHKTQENRIDRTLYW